MFYKRQYCITKFSNILNLSESNLIVKFRKRNF